MLSLSNGFSSSDTPTTDAQRERSIQTLEALRSFLPQQREDVIGIADTVLIHLKDVLLYVGMTLKDTVKKVNRKAQNVCADQPHWPFYGHDL